MGSRASLKSCGRRGYCGIILALVLGLPATAEANAGIGVFMVAVPFVVMATVPAILVEAPILSRLLGVSFLRGLWWSAVANVVSTLLGSFIAVVADLAFATMTGSSGLEMSRPAALVTLVPMFYLTWLLERRTVRQLQPVGSTQSPARATLVANSVSYALLAIAIALAPSETLDAPSMQSRARLSEALAAMRAERTEIADFHAKRKRFPEAGPIATTSRHLRSLRRDGDGRVIGVIEFPGVEAFHGKTLVMAPRVEGDAIVEWICYSPDATHRYLPAACRRGPPEAPR